MGKNKIFFQLMVFFTTISLNNFSKSNTIVIFEATEQEIEFFKHSFKNINATIEFCSEKLSLENVLKYESAEIISVSFSTISPLLIDKLPNLKLIAARSTGYDNIDMEYASARNILVANAPNYASRSVAEYTFGMILNLSRRIHEYNKKLLTDMHFDSSYQAGFDLQGKTIGIIGAGNIAREVIKIAHGFQMNVIVYSHKATSDLSIKYVSLEYLLQNSDIITIHLPSTRETHHLINKNNIKHIKKRALIINTSRGELIDTKSLVASLSNGELAGAGLDVLEEEGELHEVRELNDKSCEIRMLNQALIRMPQVIVTPHVAYNSLDAKRLLLSIVADNIISFITGNNKNIVNYSM